MAVYSEIASATNFKRKKYKVSGENGGTYVITISTATKEALIDGISFTQSVELNDLEFNNALLQKSDLKGWRIAFEVANGTTIMLGKIIGVIQQSVGGVDRTLCSCLLSNGSFVVLTVDSDKGTLSAVLASVGTMGVGASQLVFDNVSITSGGTASLNTSNFDTMIGDNDVELILALTSGETITLKRVKYDTTSASFSGAVGVENGEYSGVLYFANFVASGVGTLVEVDLFEPNVDIPSSIEPNKLATAKIFGDYYEIGGNDIEVNPTLSGNESELLGLEVNGTTYKLPSLSEGDNVVCAYSKPTDFTLEDSYSSYNRCGNEITFVLAFSITKGENGGDDLSLATFSNIPTEIFSKLVPTEVGGGSYLYQEIHNAFNGQFTSVQVPTTISKGTNNDIIVVVDTTNLVVDTKYHLRIAIPFLLTDNLSRIDSVLANNSWATIQEVCEKGSASAYWAVGDSKTDIGTDGATRTFRIVDMQNLYNKHVVFEQVELSSNSYQLNRSANVDDDNCYNNYAISAMVNTYLPAYENLLSSALKDTLSDTTVLVAKNGNNGALLSVSSKLFLQAEKEIWTSNHGSREEEFNALTTREYYQTHTTTTEHTKYVIGATSAGIRWNRSPLSGSSFYVRCVDNDGSWNYSYAYHDYRVSVCFAY